MPGGHYDDHYRSETRTEYAHQPSRDYEHRDNYRNSGYHDNGGGGGGRRDNYQRNPHADNYARQDSYADDYRRMDSYPDTEFEDARRGGGGGGGGGGKYQYQDSRAGDFRHSESLANDFRRPSEPFRQDSGPTANGGHQRSKPTEQILGGPTALEFV